MQLHQNHPSQFKYTSQVRHASWLSGIVLHLASDHNRSGRLPIISEAATTRLKTWVISTYYPALMQLEWYPATTSLLQRMRRHYGQNNPQNRLILDALIRQLQRPSSPERMH